MASIAWNFCFTLGMRPGRGLEGLQTWPPTASSTASSKVLALKQTWGVTTEGDGLL
jgi:hypothetical protein